MWECSYSYKSISSSTKLLVWRSFLLMDLGSNLKRKDNFSLEHKKLSQNTFAKRFPNLDGKYLIRWTKYTTTGSSWLLSYPQQDALWGSFRQSQLSTLLAKNLRTEEVLFDAKHLSKQKNSLNPKPTHPWQIFSANSSTLAAFIIFVHILPHTMVT